MYADAVNHQVMYFQDSAQKSVCNKMPLFHVLVRWLCLQIYKLDNPCTHLFKVPKMLLLSMYGTSKEVWISQAASLNIAQFHNYNKTNLNP